jgi:hypothetical protein
MWPIIIWILMKFRALNPKPSHTPNLVLRGQSINFFKLKYQMEKLMEEGILESIEMKISTLH